MWDFFFGPDRRDVYDGNVTIGARVFDIDVVEGVYGILQTSIEERDKEAAERWSQDPHFLNFTPLAEAAPPSRSRSCRQLLLARRFPKHFNAVLNPASSRT